MAIQRNEISGVGDYAELRLRIRQSGLLDRQPLYYITVGSLVCAALIASFLVLVISHAVVIQVLDAVFLGIVFVQCGFLAHDAGHRQITSRVFTNDLLGLFFAALVQGGSFEWWKDKHNQHHGSPNHVDLDPDVDMRVLSFTEEQALSKRGVFAVIARYQAYLFFPLLMGAHVNMLVTSVRYLIEHRLRRLWAEAALMVVHYILYFGLLIWLVGLPTAILFFVINEAVVGVYMGSTFAPNHKGMPTVDGSHRLDFLHQQVLTARNVRGGRFVDFAFGALCSQIEHHLFPTMPRNNLRRAEPIVKAFCRQHGISYYETGVLNCYIEILRHLNEVGSRLRQGKMNRAA